MYKMNHYISSAKLLEMKNASIRSVNYKLLRSKPEAK